MNNIFDHTETFASILWRHSTCKFVIAGDVTLVQGEITDFVLIKVCYQTSVQLQTVLDSFLWNCTLLWDKYAVGTITTQIVTLTFAQGHIEFAWNQFHSPMALSECYWLGLVCVSILSSQCWRRNTFSGFKVLWNVFIAFVSVIQVSKLTQPAPHGAGWVTCHCLAL